MLVLDMFTSLKALTFVDWRPCRLQTGSYRAVRRWWPL